MAGLLKNAVVVLVLITVAKVFIAADEDTATEAPTTLALQEASQEPEETTRRDGQFTGRYPMELCNPFYEFWKNHRLVWTRKSSDFVSEKCKQEEYKDMNETGVMLKTTRATLDNKLVKEDVFWKFRTNGSIARHSIGGEEVIYLVYKNDSSKCGVVKHEEWFYWKEQDTSAYHESCKLTWCTCIPTGPESNRYACLNNPFFEVILYDHPKDEVPQDCKNDYDSRRTPFTTDDNDVTPKKDCEF